MCKFGAHRTTPTTKSATPRGDIFAMAKMGRVSGFWRFLGKYLGTGQKLPYWELTGENPWIKSPGCIGTLRLGCLLARKSTCFRRWVPSTVFLAQYLGIFLEISKNRRRDPFSPWRNIGVRGEQQLNVVCSDLHETCTFIRQLFEIYKSGD